MSVLTLYVDEVMRTLSNDGQYPFVVNDKTVDIVRFALNTGFTDVALDEYSALRVMYQRPGETEVRAQTLTYYDTDGLHNYYDWHLLSADLTEKGTLTVALCILRVDSDVEEWHTTPCQVRVLDTIHTDDSDEGDESITPTVAQRVTVLESVIQGMAGGAPVVVSNASEMTDTAQIYVLSTDGMWYYYDGSAWVAGGTYGATDTDTTLSIAGKPADAKAVGDALADAMTGEALEDDESMKYVLSSKYDDFKLVDGYGYFDAKKFFNFFDFNGAPYQTSDKNCIFRFSHTGKMLITEDALNGFFSPDFPVQEHDFNGGVGYLPEGYWITVDPDRPTGSRFVTVPRSIFGDSGNLGNFVFNFLDGSIGVKLDTEHLVEYDPAEIITAVATSTTYNNGVVEGVTFYRGALNWVWSDLFDFTANTANFNRFFNSLGFNESYSSDYAKEYVYVKVATPNQLIYSLKADAVGEHTLENVKGYLINTRHLKFYYVAPEEETT